MREIKFRAYATHTKAMIDWDSMQKEGAMQFILNYDDVFKLMQYTGIKDKNGVEMYLGDIVTYDIIDNPRELRFNYLGHLCSWDGSEEYSIYMTDLKSIEVIGNIHENKDML